MKQFKASGHRKDRKKETKSEGRTERPGMTAMPGPPSLPLGATLPGSSEKNTDYLDADRELNLSPLGTAQSGFGEFFDDEWDEDEDVANDFLRARDIAAYGLHRPMGKRDLPNDDER